MLVVSFKYKQAVQFLHSLSRTHLRYKDPTSTTIFYKVSTEFLRPDMTATIQFSDFVMRILERSQPKVYRKLKSYQKFINLSRLSLYQCRIEMPPYFFVSWIISWFTHDLSSLSEIGRVLDFFVLLPPSAVGYLSAVLIAKGRDSVLAYDVKRDEFGDLHDELKRLPEMHDIVGLLPDALRLMHRLPPSKICQLVPELKGYVSL